MTDWTTVDPDPLGYTRVYSSGAACEVDFEQDENGLWVEHCGPRRRATREEMVLAGYYRAIPSPCVDERGAAYENMILASQEDRLVDY